MKKTFVILPILFVLPLILSGCNQTTPATTPSPTTQPEISQTIKIDDVVPPGATVSMKEVSMDMKPYSFSVTQISARPGEIVQVTLNNTQGTHDFVIDELAVQSEVTSTGESTVVSFQIPSDVALGTEYQYYCSIMDHKQRGMVGIVRVE